jgi:hypothetical protein
MVAGEPGYFVRRGHEPPFVLCRVCAKAEYGVEPAPVTPFDPSVGTDAKSQSSGDV